MTTYSFKNKLFKGFLFLFCVFQCYAWVYVDVASVCLGLQRPQNWSHRLLWDPMYVKIKSKFSGKTWSILKCLRKRKEKSFRSFSQMENEAGILACWSLKSEFNCHPIYISTYKKKHSFLTSNIFLHILNFSQVGMVWK